MPKKDKIFCRFDLITITLIQVYDFYGFANEKY